MGLIRNVFVAFKNKSKSHKVSSIDLNKSESSSNDSKVVKSQTKVSYIADEEELINPQTFVERSAIIKMFCEMKVNNLFTKEYDEIISHVKSSVNNPSVTSIVNKDNSASSLVGYKIEQDFNRNYIVTVTDSLTWSHDTSSDFWNLIYKNKIKTVVVLGNSNTNSCPHDSTKEIASPSCYFNWPNGSGEKYGKVEVRLKQTVHESMFQYMIKHFSIRKNRHIGLSTSSSFNSHNSSVIPSNDLEISLFYYYGWSENDLESMEPCSINSLLNLIHEIDLSHSCKSSPILIHCQSGCMKRSIPFTIIDYEIFRLYNDNKLSVFKTTIDTLKSVPISKINLTSPQYYLIYETILLYLTNVQLTQHQVCFNSQKQQPSNNNDFSFVICSDNLSDVSEKMSDDSYMNNLYEYLSMLTHWLTAEHWSSMEANQPSNQTKNRFIEYVPLDSHRVHLYQEERQNSLYYSCIKLSDHYINASFINLPLFSEIELIITQAPLISTANDFWTMVEEKQIELIVMLNKPSDEYAYWSSQPVVSTDLDGIMVQVESEQHYNHSGFESKLSCTKCRLTERIIHLMNFSHRINLHKVRHLEIHGWNDKDDITIDSILSIAMIIWKYMSKVNYQKQVVLQCEDGISFAGLLSFIIIMIDYLHNNGLNEIDIQMLVIKIRQCHPRIITSSKQLTIIIKCAIKLLKEPNLFY